MVSRWKASTRWIWNLSVMGTACVLLLAAGLAFGAGRELLFEIKDPFGDDHGAGSLRYPTRSDLNPGDLDLLGLKAFRVKDATLFRATFARDIRSGEGEAIDGLGTPLNEVARLGFYTLNIDLYIDTDRVPGAGNVTMLPGRKAEVAPPDAWEKVIVLTPRPDVLRNSLERLRLREWKEDERRRRSVNRDEVKQERRRIREALQPLIYFPERVVVRGRTIDFYVPDAFFGGVPADAGWSYVVAVTGARIEQRFELGGFGKYSRESFDGLVLPIVPGGDTEAFGGGEENDPLQPPLVDVLVPKNAPRTQEQILGYYNSYEQQPAQVPGVVPAASTDNPYN